jgi:S1-C subfamily serine protease
MQLIRQAEAARADTIEKVYGAVVSIFGEDKEGGGSGVLFDQAGFALTNHHVVAAIGKTGKAGLSDGELYDWTLVGTDPAGDIAIIQLQGKDRWPMATDYSPTVTLGIVSGVQRYQGGGMVYGSCIQVDSAINPGNSGGPLMNVQGQVIGINGRAAFAERGRVNVGVGFAVSMQQIKNFIPDLLACKVAQHGTLDAQFGMRDGKVVCDAINLDSRAARAGLKLGDRLISVNALPIRTSNQLASVISMMPADWPVRIVYEHNGKEFEFDMRLSTLTYSSVQLQSQEPGQEPAQEPEPAPGEGGEPRKEDLESGAEGQGGSDQDSAEESEKDVEEDCGDASDDEGKSEEELPAQNEGRARQRRAGLGQLIPGRVLSADLNRANALRLLQRWQAVRGEASDRSARWTDRLTEGDVVKEWLVHVTAAGDFSIAHGRATTFRKGRQFFRTESGKPQAVDASELLEDPLVLSVFLQAARHDLRLTELIGKPNLDGGDLVDGQPVYRLKFEEATDDAPLYVWLSQDQVPRLVKAGFDKNGSLTRNVVAFRDYDKESGFFALSTKRSLVAGVSARVRRVWTASDLEFVDVPELLRSDDNDE